MNKSKNKLENLKKRIENYEIDKTNELKNFK